MVEVKDLNGSKFTGSKFFCKRDKEIGNKLLTVFSSRK